MSEPKYRFRLQLDVTVPIEQRLRSGREERVALTAGAGGAALLYVVCWYAALAIPTVVLKFFYFGQLYRGGFSAALTNFQMASGTIGRTLLTLSFFTGDLLECALIVGVTYLMGHRWLNVRFLLLIPSTTAIILLLAAANWLSFRQLGTFVTTDSLGVSFSWLSENPDVLDTYLRRRNIAVVLLGIAWSVVPVAVAALAGRFGLSGGLPRRVFATLVALVAFAGVAHLALRGVVFDETPFPFRGYWSSTLAALALPEGMTLATKTEPVETELLEAYERLVYPLGPAASRVDVAEFALAQRKLRHVLILSLETAPLKYYPIVANPDLPTFARLSERAIVLEQHFSNTPYTNRANYAMLSGTYPPHATTPIKYGKMATDGLAAVLQRHGYRTIYVDSSKIDWRPGKKHRRVIESLGFEQLLERAQTPDGKGPKSYAGKLAAEHRSFRLALDGILRAEREGEKAFVFVDTIIGHYPWPSVPQQEQLPGSLKLLELCRTFDGMLAGFLAELETAGLAEELLLVVIGDHGLRYDDEYASLDERLGDPEISYHVPCLLYAPGLIDEPVHLTHQTSHVDLTPTLLDLVGIPTGTLLHHGTNVFDSTLEDRVVFLMSNALTPNDRFRWHDYVFTANSLTGQSYIAYGPDWDQMRPLEEGLVGLANVPDSLRAPQRTLRMANGLFDDTAVAFLYRARPR